MSYVVTEQDLRIIKQKNYILFTKCILLDKTKSPVADIVGTITSGSYGFTDNSLTRRAMSLNVFGEDILKILNESAYFTHWIDVEVGIYDNVSKEVVFYKMGRYGFDRRSYSRGISNDQVSLNLIDEMGMLSRNHRGALYGASTTVIRALNPDGTRLENFVSGDPLLDIGGFQTKNSLANALMSVFSLVGIDNAEIDDIGAYSVVSAKTDEEKEIAKESFLFENGYNYDEIPYDLEFPVGTGVSDVINTITTLYDGYEAYFDVNGVPHVNMIPSGYGEPNYLDYEVFEDAVISETVDTNIYDVKNVIEVWGREQNPDNYSSTISKTTHTGTGSVQQETYTIKLENYRSYDADSNPMYQDGFVVAARFNSSNTLNRVSLKVVSDNVNGDGDTATVEYPSSFVYNPLTSEHRLDAGSIQKDNTYLFQWSANIGGWYFLGQYQVHALAVLTDGSASIDELALKYNVNKDAIYLDVNPESPYCIEKIGEVVGQRVGSGYESISSDLIAKSSAKFELWKSARRTDIITLECLIIPFIDINKKISYKRQNGDIEEFIVKKINGNLGEGTMTLELMKFYPMYEQ